MGTAMSPNFNDNVHNAVAAPWKLAVEPFRVAPRVYYVGNFWAGVYLIDTEEGLVLLDTAVFETAYLVLESIRKLGFDPYQVKHIMISHLHFDHTGGVEVLRQLTGAKVWMSKIDADLRMHPANLAINKSGDIPFNVPYYEVDAYYEEDKPIQLGSVTIQPILTPGHSPGATSFLITMPDEEGKPITAAMHGGVGPITMTDQWYADLGVPNLRPRFIEDCERLKALHVDIAIPSHPAHGDLFQRKSSDPMDYRPLVDDREWAKFLEERKQFIIEFDAAQKAKQAAK